MNLQYLTIVKFDWMQFSRSGMFWLLNVLMLFTGIYAAFYGKGQVVDQQHKIELLKRDIDSSMHIVAAKLRQQDTVASWHYDDWLFALHSNRPDGIAALSLGQRDLHKFAVSISTGTYFYNRYAGGYQNKTLSGEIANPQKQFTGHLDTSFILVFLLPLYFILISYNLLSAEQENGTLSLLALQKIRLNRLLFTKLMLRTIITVIVGWLIILLAVTVNQAWTDPRLIYFLIGVLLYILCWSGIVALVISFYRSSGSNALVLISTWLLFCFVLPAAFTAILNAAYPQGARADLVTAVQQANAKVFNTSRKDLSLRFYKAYPHYNVVAKDTFPGGWYNPRWMRAVHLLLDADVKPLEDKYREKLQQRIAAADKLDYVSPALLAQSVFNRLAAGDMQQMFDYDASIYAHFAAWRDYLDKRTYLNNDRLTRHDFENLPRQDFEPVINYSAIVFRLVALFGFAVILFIISSMLLHKNSKYIRS